MLWHLTGQVGMRGGIPIIMLARFHLQLDDLAKSLQDVQRLGDRGSTHHGKSGSHLLVDVLGGRVVVTVQEHMRNGYPLRGYPIAFRAHSLCHVLQTMFRAFHHCRDLADSNYLLAIVL